MLKKILFTLLIVVCGIQNILKVNAGSYLITFILIYITIYYIKKYKPQISCEMALVTLLVCVIIQGSFEALCISKGIDKRAWLIDDSGDFLIYLMSMCFFVLFDKLAIKDNRFLNLLAGNTLMVYLIHDNVFLRSIVWKLARTKSFFNSPFMIFHGVAISSIILFGGLLVGIIYSYLSRVIMKT